MIRKRTQSKWAIIPIFVLCAILFIYSSSLQAVNWIALPPYNILWPLWSPALSPLDPLTGQPIPLITHLDRNTILPVQPALAWDPFQTQPYLLYNNPLVYYGGLLYFDQLLGFNAWPPSDLFNPLTGFPIPLSLPWDYSLLIPTDYNLLSYLIPLANNMFSIQYGVPLPNLLTTDQIFYGI